MGCLHCQSFRGGSQNIVEGDHSFFVTSSHLADLDLIQAPMVNRETKQLNSLIQFERHYFHVCFGSMSSRDGDLLYVNKRTIAVASVETFRVAVNNFAISGFLSLLGPANGSVGKGLIATRKRADRLTGDGLTGFEKKII